MQRATSVTQPLTEWTDYQTKETSNRNKADYWQPASCTSSEAVDHVGKVKQILLKSKECLETGFYTNVLEKTSLVQQRQERRNMAHNAIVMEYEQNIEKLKSKIIKLDAKLLKTAEKPSKLEEKAEKLLVKIVKIVSKLTELNKIIQEREAAIDAEPAAKDARTSLRTTQVLDAFFQSKSHDMYLKLLAQLKEKGSVVDGLSNEDCWDWSGRVSGIIAVKSRINYMANCLNASACAFDILRDKKADAEFLKAKEEPAQSEKNDDSENDLDEAKQKLAEMLFGGLGSGSSSSFSFRIGSPFSSSSLSLFDVDDLFK